MIEFLRTIAQAAGEKIRSAYYQRNLNIEHKGEIDLVTEVDIACEKIIVEAIKENFPTDSILAEESAETSGSSARRWIIDPVDGTTNLAHRFPFVAVSIGVEENGVLTYGVVYNPILDELFEAQLGKGAYLNGAPIQVSSIDTIKNALIATGFPYDRWQRGEFYMREYLAFMQRCQAVRRCGSAAIDLCYSACGRVDGFFERKLHPWDMAAGSLILTEAGGKVTRFDGSRWQYRDDTILASNSKLHREMQTILAHAHD